MSPAPAAPDWKAPTVRAHLQMLAASFAQTQDAVQDLAAELQDEAVQARRTGVPGPLSYYAHKISRAARHAREAGHVLSSLEYELFGAAMDEAPPRA